MPGAQICLTHSFRGPGYLAPLKHIAQLDSHHKRLCEQECVEPCGSRVCVCMLCRYRYMFVILFMYIYILNSVHVRYKGVLGASCIQVKSEGDASCSCRS